MRKIYKSKKFLNTFILSVCLGASSMLSAQITGGTVTINAASATSGTNYISWADFATALNSNTLTGALTVNVMSNRIETSAITLNANSGSSSTNTITINGNSYSLESSITNEACIVFNGLDYTNITTLVVRNTNATNPLGIRFANASDYNTIQKCDIQFSNITSGSTTRGCYIGFTSTPTALTSTVSSSMGSYNTIDGNKMSTTNVNSPGPGIAIVMNGNTNTYSSTAQNNTISNNVIQNTYWVGIYCQYTNGLNVTNNDISRTNSSIFNCNTGSNYGIFCNYTYAADRSTSISNNNIHDFPFAGATTSSTQNGFWGLFINYNYGNSTYRFMVNNNTVKNITASSTIYGLLSQYNYYPDLNSNMFDNLCMPTSSGTFYGINNYFPYNNYKMNKNTVKNCKGGSNWYGLFQSYIQSVSGPSDVSGNTVTDNTTYNLFSGIRMDYNNNITSATNKICMNGNTVTNNTTSQFGYSNVYAMVSRYYGFYEMNDNLIQNNSFSTYYGYFFGSEWYTNNKIQRNRVIGNKANNSSGGQAYSLFSYYVYNTDITDNLIVNNVGYYGTYGIYAYSFASGTYTANIRQNTVSIDGSLSSNSYHYSYPIYGYLYYHTAVRIIGNIIDSKNGYGFQHYCYNQNSSNLTINHNSYHVRNHSYTYWATPAGGGNTFSSWIGTGLPGSGELDAGATGGHNFASNWASNRFINQNNVTTLSSINDKDAYGVLRNPSSSDRGAVEGILDIQQVSNTFAPNPSECAGYTASPTLTLQNNFSEAVTGFKVGCSDNGVLVATATVTGTIAVGGTTTVTFAPIKFSKTGSRKIKFFLLSADDVPSNDTITQIFTINSAPGGGLLTKNSGSAAKALFFLSGKPDVTTNGQAIIYDLTAPATVGYTNADYGTKWITTVSAVDELGNNANSEVTSNFAAPLTVTVNPTLAFVDRTLTISIKIIDLVSGCDSIYTRKILVAPQAVPDFILPALLCDKSDIYFENTSTVSSGAILSNWDFGDGSPNIDATSPSHLYSGPGAYTVTYTAITSPWGYETVKTQIVNISDIPSADFKIVNACQGKSVKLTNATTIPSGVLSYEWNYGDGSPLFNTSSAAIINKTYAVPNGYAVTLTASANGCKNAITKNVYTFARPVASFVKLQGNCDNEMYNFKNASTIPNGTFGNYWDFDDAGSKATVADPSYNFTTAGTKNIKLKVVSEFGCDDSLTTTIVVKPASVSDFTYTPVCSRTPTAFTNTTAIPAGTVVSSYTWDFGDGTTTSATSPTKGWSSIGPKIISLNTVLNNGCKDAISKQVNVGVQPLVAFQVADQCAGTDVPFVNLTNYTQGNIKYTWTFGDNQSSSDASPKHIYSGSSVIAQSYTVTLKGEVLGGCADSLTKIVTINPLPTACSFTMDRDYNTSLTAYKFTPVGSASGLTFSWITGDGNQVNTNGVGTSYSYQDKGKYCVTMISKNNAGCECSSTKCATLTLGTDNISLNKAISVFPNPTSSVFSVKVDATVTDVMVVNVYNTLGELVNTVSVNANTADIDMSNFASGIYVVKVISGNQIGTAKITVAR